MEVHVHTISRTGGALISRICQIPRRSLILGISFFSLFILLSPVAMHGQTYPFQNPELSSQERARDLISRLTLEEKATLMCDQSDAIPRLGIRNSTGGARPCTGTPTTIT